MAIDPGVVCNLPSILLCECFRKEGAEPALPLLVIVQGGVEAAAGDGSRGPISTRPANPVRPCLVVMPWSSQGGR